MTSTHERLTNKVSMIVHIYSSIDTKSSKQSKVIVFKYVLIDNVFENDLSVVRPKKIFE